MTMSELIKKNRLKRNLTQLDISRGLRLTSPQHISNVERGICVLSPRLYRKIAKILDIPVESLIEAQIEEYRERIIKKMNAK